MAQGTVPLRGSPKANGRFRRKGPIKKKGEAPLDGEDLRKEGMFCSLDFVRSLPYAVWKLPKGNGVETDFFASGKFWAYPWQLYYVWDHKFNPTKPLILVRTESADNFVLNIRLAHPQYPLRYPSQTDVRGAVIDLSQHINTTAYPRRLGTASDAEAFTRLKQNAHMTESDLPPHLELLLTETIQESLDCVSKNKSKAKQKAAEERGRAALAGMQTLQKYLGLLDTAVNDQLIDHKAEIALERPPQHRSLAEPILISVDVEAWEMDANCITEIGISTLDTRDILGVAPGSMAEAWRPYIRARHLRVEEVAHLCNKKFVSGCPERFEFGTSEFLPAKDIVKAVASCFRPPYSNWVQGQGQKGIAQPALTVYPKPDQPEKRAPFPSATAEDDDDDDSDGPQGQEQPQEEKRNIVLVGHSTASDITYLRKLGYDVRNLSTLQSPVQDTTKLWSSVTGEWNNVALGKLCSEVGIDPWFLHNAGNDAWYTLACALALAVADAAGVKFGGRPGEGGGADGEGSGGGSGDGGSATGARVSATEVKVAVQGGDSVGEMASVGSRPKGKAVVVEGQHGELARNHDAAAAAAFSQLSMRPARDKPKEEEDLMTFSDVEQ